MTAPVKISCFIRTLNEERMIDEVIEAAFLVADEVIVIDSLSTDRTREIAAEKGAIVIEQEWLGQGLQKRVGEENTKHDWLLDIDADEIITIDLANEIKALFAKGEPKHSVFEIPLVTAPPVGKIWYNSYIRPHTKLYDKRVLRAPAHEVWDHFKIPDNISVGKLKGHILHHSFKDLSFLLQKVNFWTDTKLLQAKPKPIFITIFRLLFAFPFYFLRQYLLRNLWRAGLYGFIFAMISAFGRWLSDAKTLERHLQKKQGINTSTKVENHPNASSSKKKPQPNK